MPLLQVPKEILHFIKKPLEDHFRPVMELLGHHQRRWHRHNGRLYLELRDIKASEFPHYAKQIEQGLSALHQVRWVKVHHNLGQVIVEGKNGHARPAALLKIIDQVERKLCLEEEPFFSHRLEVPADEVPLYRLGVEVWADGFSMLISLLHKIFLSRPLALEVDAAALFSLVENAPHFREYFEQRYEPAAVDLALNLSNSIAQGLAQGPLGPGVDMVKRFFLMKENLARRDSWKQRERDLIGSHPESFPLAELRERAAPLPQGSIEEYSDRAWYASLGAFGLGAVTTRSFHKAAGALFGGLPKPAFLGREAFAAQLSQRLAAQGTVVLAPEALRRLDRINCWVVEGELLLPQEETPQEEIDRFVSAIRRVRSDLIIISKRPELFQSWKVEKIIPPGKQLGHEIRRLQRRKKVVGLVSSRNIPAFSSADLSVGLHRPPLTTPWQAHVLCGKGLNEVSFLVEACQAAQSNSHWSVNLSYAAVSVAFLLSARGLKRQTTSQVMSAVNVAALLSMAHGWWAATKLPQPSIAKPKTSFPWHQMETREVLKILKTREAGLNVREAKRRYRPQPKTPSSFSVLTKLLIEELNNPLTPILSAGAGLSAIVGSLVDASMVLTVLGLNGMIGALERFKTEEAVLHLNQNNHHRVRVNRGGNRRFIEHHHLVPGDIVRLHEGDIVPADCRVLKCSALEVDESSLTGESIPVKKSAEPVKAKNLAERRSMIYEGTAVTAGEALAIAVAVGEETESQRSKIYENPPPTSGVESRLEGITRFTLPVTLLSGAAIVSSGLMRGQPLPQVLSSGVSLAVAAIPEGLPIMAMVAQLAAARRLARHGVLAQNVRAIENLGRVNVICVDKTGTLTHGRIQLELVSDGFQTQPLKKLEDDFRAILIAGLMATPARKKGRSVPHRTDQALIDGAEQARLFQKPEVKGFKRITELPFGPSRMYHVVLGEYVSRDKKTTRKIFVKGSPEVLLEKCTWRLRDGRRHRLSARSRKIILAQSLAMAREGRRILAVAERDTSSRKKISDGQIKELTFRGFLAFSDPVRETAAQSVAQIRQAGIEVVMVTGDHPSTAERIAAELEILNHTDATRKKPTQKKTAKRSSIQKQVITGEELDGMSDAQLIRLLPKISVFARVDPAHKARIVKAYQQAGKNVAMTGDGTNDAAAIRMANVGIAISRHATPAARKVADLVITDSKIETILEVIVEGRGLWAAVRDAVSVLVGGNLGEIGFTLLLGLISGDSPLNPRQLLLVNLLTDVAPAMVIASKAPQDKSVEDLLQEGPEVSLGAPLTEDITWRALFTALGAGGAWIGARLTGTATRARTVGLLALVGTQLGQTLLAGGKSKGVWATGFGSLAALAGIVQTPGLSGAFGCRPVGPVGWSIALSSALASIAAASWVPKFFPQLPAKVRKMKLPRFMKSIENKVAGTPTPLTS